MIVEKNYDPSITKRGNKYRCIYLISKVTPNGKTGEGKRKKKNVTTHGIEKLKVGKCFAIMRYSHGIQV